MMAISLVQGGHEAEEAAERDDAGGDGKADKCRADEQALLACPFRPFRRSTLGKDEARGNRQPVAIRN